MEILYYDVVIFDKALLTVIFSKNGLFYTYKEYISIEYISKIFIVLERDDKLYQDKDEGDKFIISHIKNKTSNYNNVNPEDILIDYPKLSSIILPYLRDKKLDELA